MNNPKELLKQVKGAYYNIKEASSDAILVQWKDSSNVTLASNCHAAAPLGQARCWSNKDKKTISVPLTCTYLVSAYNKYMGGVDRRDQNIAKYRISIHTKKWW